MTSTGFKVANLEEDMKSAQKMCVLGFFWYIKKTPKGGLECSLNRHLRGELLRIPGSECAAVDGHVVDGAASDEQQQFAS